MCLVYLYLVRFCSAANFFFSKWGGGGGGGGRLTNGTYIFLLLLFLKNALLSLLFHSKMSFTRKNPDFFPRSLRSLAFNKLTNDFFFKKHAA